MAWDVAQKKVRGVAMIDPAILVDPTRKNVFVRFDKEEYDPRLGKTLHGKLYDSPEEAIEELGSKVVERVLRDIAQIDGVHVTISLNKWVEE